MSQALLLCAGRGERLRPLTDTRPKPLISVGGEVLIDRHLRRLVNFGVRRVVINLGWLGEKIVEHVGNGSRFGLSVIYSPEGFPTLDTGGAIVQALGQLNNAPFFVINADVWTDFELPNDPTPLLGPHNAAIGLVENPPYKDNGDFANVDGFAANQGSPLKTFSGFACYRHAFFAGLSASRFSVVPLLRKAADQRALAAFTMDAQWFDIGTPDRLADVNRRLSRVD